MAMAKRSAAVGPSLSDMPMPCLLGNANTANLASAQSGGFWWLSIAAKTADPSRSPSAVSSCEGSQLVELAAHGGAKSRMHNVEFMVRPGTHVVLFSMPFRLLWRVDARSIDSTDMCKGLVDATLCP